MVGARTNLWHTIGTVKAPDAEIVRSLRTFTGWSEALPEADLRTDESLDDVAAVVATVGTTSSTSVDGNSFPAISSMSSRRACR